MEAEFEAAKEETQQVFKVLEALKQASHDLQTNPRSESAESNSPAIKALLDFDIEADSILSNDPHLSNLSHHLSTLKTLIDTFQNYSGRHGLKSFLARRGTSHQISRVAGSIESEIQAWIDRESVEKLTKALLQSMQHIGLQTLQQGVDSISVLKKKRSNPLEIEEEIEFVELIQQFERRISRGFDRELQDLILKSKLFGLLESTLCNSDFSKKIREESAFAISELIRFNKDVFVGQVLMGQTIRALISMASSSSLSLQVLCSLIKSIKSPLVDEIESNGEIPKIISFLSSENLSICTMAMDCVLEIGYFGRKEAIEAMLNSGLMKKLVELQRSELGGDLIELGKFDEQENGIAFLEDHPFASCVARFAVQLEVGEGLRQRERRAFKQEMLKRIREASVSDAEAATIIAEVLWGSSP